jgi:hypothetical protein
MAPSLNLLRADSSAAAETAAMGARKLLIRKAFGKLVSNDIHTRRRSGSKVLVAFVIAAALPVIVAFSREHGDPVAATVEGREAVASIPSAPAVVTSAQDWTGDAADSASMMVVGSLLIGIGSIVRRAA